MQTTLGLSRSLSPLGYVTAGLGCFAVPVLVFGYRYGPPPPPNPAVVWWVASIAVVSVIIAGRRSTPTAAE